MLDVLAGQITTINESYTQQIEMVDLLIESSTNLLDKCDGKDGLLETIENLNKTYTNINTDISTTIDNLNRKLSEVENNVNTFSNALTNSSDAINQSTQSIVSMSSSLTGNFSQMASVISRSVDLQKQLNTQSQKSATQQSNVSGSQGNDSNKKQNFFDWMTKYAVPVIGNIAKYGKENWMNLQDSVRPLNAQMQMSVQNMTNFTVSLGQASINLRRFGKGYEDLAEIHSKMWSEMGRITYLAHSDIENVGAMSALIGNEGASQFISDMDSVGASVSTSVEYFEKMRDVSGKAGVDLVKATEIVQKNLQKAQTYGFRDGLNSLTRMASMTMQMRMNMEQVFKLSDSNRDFENAIENAARVQVLGGGFASMFGNAMSNIYNAHYDQEANAEKLLSVGSKYMNFNKEKGFMEFNSMPAREMAREFATAMGLDFNELITGWSRAGIKEQIEKEHGTGLLGGLDKEDTELAKSKASYGKDEKGNMGWVVSVFNAERKRHENISVNQLKPEDMESLRATTDTRLAELARSTLSIEKQIENLLKMPGDAAAVTLEEQFGKWTHDWLGENGERAARFISGNTGLTNILTAIGIAINTIIGIITVRSLLGKGGKGVQQATTPASRQPLTGKTKSGKTFTTGGTPVTQAASKGTQLLRFGGRALGPATAAIMGGIDVYNTEKFIKENKELEEKNKMRGEAYGGLAASLAAGWAAAKAGAWIGGGIGTAVAPGLGTGIGAFIGGAAAGIPAAIYAHKKGSEWGGNIGSRWDDNSPVTHDGEYTTMISPTGHINRFDSKDQILAAKPDGALSQFLNGIGVNQPATPNYGTSNNPKQHITISHNISGSLQITDPTGRTRDWDELVRNPQFVSALTDKIAIQINSNMNRGVIENSGGILYGNYSPGMFG